VSKNLRVSSAVPLPVGHPVPGASLAQSVGRFFRGYFHFSGRASRSEFWWAMLAVWLLSLVPLVPAMLLAARLESWRQPGSATVITQVEAQQTVTTFVVLLGASVLLSLITTIPTYAVMWRRLQDANVHGAWILLTLVGLSIIPLVICFFGSNPAGARFGPAPPPRPAFGFPSGSGFSSPAMARQQRFGTPPAVQQAPTPTASYGTYGGASYGGASYGGTPYGQPRHDAES
jgi:uncharacterized membrane protein YhaH (DUF805 family)